jgi:hypothetical protein
MEFKRPTISTVRDSPTLRSTTRNSPRLPTNLVNLYAHSSCSMATTRCLPLTVKSKYHLASALPHLPPLSITHTMSLSTPLICTTTTTTLVMPSRISLRSETSTIRPRRQKVTSLVRLSILRTSGMTISTRHRRKATKKPPLRSLDAEQMSERARAMELMKIVATTAPCTNPHRHRHPGTVDVELRCNVKSRWTSKMKNSTFWTRWIGWEN